MRHLTRLAMTRTSIRNQREDVPRSSVARFALLAMRPTHELIVPRARADVMTPARASRADGRSGLAGSRGVHGDLTRGDDLIFDGPG
jgi:hypothetical protein